ncbi:uncharacterized WD repeat-containing protein alr3466-like [Drosophila obscura]|uniref:uncharacterized WD repeat-containing protein alr3466-like n=1 Tax=Drosophila obscura TaxID=7282 RepID=UPI001BB0DFDF|nr:uncharacterized WD repeat-containing protein alr3466-like [Drosophila obscura]
MGAATQRSPWASQAGQPEERPTFSSPAAGSGRSRKRDFAGHTNAKGLMKVAHALKSGPEQAFLVHVFSVDASKPLEDMTLNTESSDKLVKRSLLGHQGRGLSTAAPFRPTAATFSAARTPIVSRLARHWLKAGTACVWDSEEIRAPLYRPRRRGRCLFHPNGHYLATGSSGGIVRIWGIVKGHQVRLLSGHMARICSLAFSKCGRFLASGGADNLVIVWDLPRERMIRCLSHHTAAVNSCVFDMNNNLLVVGSRDGRLSVWDFDRLVQESGAHENSSSVPPAEELPLKSYANHEGPICKVAFNSGNIMFGVRLESFKKS